MKAIINKSKDISQLTGSYSHGFQYDEFWRNSIYNSVEGDEEGLYIEFYNNEGFIVRQCKYNIDVYKSYTVVGITLIEYKL